VNAAKAESSEALFRLAKALIPGGVNSPVRAFEPYPFFVSSAKGSRIKSLEGFSYVDYCMAYGPLIFGHAPEEVLGAVRQQLDKGTLYGAPTEAEVEFAGLIARSVPCIEMLRLVNSGTEATMHAIRLARGYTSRKKIVKFEGCFHGSHDYVLVKAGSGASTFGIPDSEGIPEDTTRNTIILPYNDIEALERVIREAGQDIAAVILEPVMGNMGVILPKDDYLKRVRSITEEEGILLIFDEVITGFRLALGGAQEYYGVKPDLATLGKILGGGLPLAAYGGRREIMQHVSPSGKVYQAGTFSGNPISVAAGYATVKALREKRGSMYPKLEEAGLKVRKVLKELVSDRHIDAQVNGVASMFQIFFAPNPVVDYASARASDTLRFHKYFSNLLQQGVFIPPSQFETCFLSTAHSSEDLETTIEAFDRSLRNLSEKGE